MANETFLQIPNDIDDSTTLRRVLTSIVEAIDKIRGDRGDDPALKKSQLVSTASSLQELVEDFNKLDGQYIRIDGKNGITGVLSYTSKHSFSGNQLVDAAYVLDKVKTKDVDLTGYLQAESVSAPALLAGNTNTGNISAKVDEIITSLTTSGVFT